eukprot:7844441-Pyramimonas_sp.AAC.2
MPPRKAGDLRRCEASRTSHLSSGSRGAPDQGPNQDLLLARCAPFRSLPQHHVRSFLARQSGGGTSSAS